jgi:hypothetical protein
MPDFNRARNGGSPSPGKGRRSVDLITVPQCHVCQSNHRKTIEKLLAVGTSYSEIERSFGIDRRGISHHDKEHLNLESAAIRRIIEQEAERAEANIEEGIQGAVKRRVYLETALQKGLKALADDTIIVEPKDVLAIIEKLDKIDSVGEEAALEELRLQFQAYLQAMKEVVPGEMWDRITGRTRELLTISSTEWYLEKKD